MIVPVEQRQRLPRRYIVGIILLSAGMLVLNIPNLKGQSLTVDEYAHLPAGYVHLSESDFSLYSKTPPLIRSFEALPLLVFKPNLNRENINKANGAWAPWWFADQFVNNNRDQVLRLWMAGRAMAMILGVALAVVVFLWSNDLYGPRAGLLAMFLVAASPNILAHAALATVDVGFTLFFVLTCYLMWRYFKSHRKITLLGAGISFGAAQLSKYSGLLLAPILLASLSAIYLHGLLMSKAYPSSNAFHSLKKTLLAGFALFMVGLVVINIGYLGQRTFEPLPANCRSSSLLAQLSKGLPESWPIPLPADYVIGLDAQLADAEQGEFPNFINGQWRSQGVWYYFLEALLLKVPIPTLILIASGLLAGLTRLPTSPQTSRFSVVPEDIDVPAWPFVHLPAALFLGIASMFGNLQIGLRYVLPVLPLGFMIASRIVRMPNCSSNISERPQKPLTKKGGAIVLLLCLWQIVELVQTAPHYLAHFNQLGGGTQNGHYYLIDSNIDWGQDLPGLKQQMDKIGIDEVGLLYFGHADPSLYGIKFHLPRRSDALIAVSVNFLHGYPYALTYLHPWTKRPPLVTDPAYYDTLLLARALLYYEPLARIGGSIYLYDLRNFLNKRP